MGCLQTQNALESNTSTTLYTIDPAVNNSNIYTPMQRTENALESNTSTLYTNYTIDPTVNNSNKDTPMQRIENASSNKRKKTNKTFAILMDVYLNQLKRQCTTFSHWDVPKEIVAICISYCSATDGELIMKKNSFIQLNANHEYVFEKILVGDSSTLSAKTNDNDKAKITIHCFGDIELNPYSYIHLNKSLKLSSYIGYAIYIESFGNIIMKHHSHIEIDSDNASIFIKCKKLIMAIDSEINAEQGQKIVLVVADDECRNKIKTTNLYKITPKPNVHHHSPSDALNNINL